jgi:hypothetical protein
MRREMARRAERRAAGPPAGVSDQPRSDSRRWAYRTRHRAAGVPY